MELEHFDKHFVKNTRREDLAEKHFGDTPKVGQNKGLFCTEPGHFFRFSKKGRGVLPPPP